MSNSLSRVEEKLPPGFRFHPRDDELICDYLMKKLFVVNSSSSEEPFTLLVEVDLNKCEPWDIPERACVGGKEWYFYSQRDRKYATGLRTNRATVSGYWKATGKDRAVVRRGSLVGMRKTLVFYQGRAPKGRKTDWVMHEFRLEGPNFSPPKLSSSKEDWVLCRAFHKSRESTPPRPTLVDNYDESGCSSLPDLMDSFVSFDQTPRTNSNVNDNDRDRDNNNDNINQSNNSLAYEQVPCFSNQPNPNHSNSTPIFHVAQNQPTITHAGPYHAPAYDNAQVRHDGPTFSAMPIGSVGACDRHVIKHALTHLTSNVKDATMTMSPSPVSLPGGSSSESYLSDVGFPTMSMWTSHY